ncbi:MAG: ABC transporter ATP-binding protein [Anaerolineaceae bacterium]
MTTFAINQISCAYYQLPVLNQISFEVHTGEILALIGPNGVGKTTLLRTMARLMRPVEGKVILMDRDLWQISLRDTARSLAFATQTGSDTWDATVEQIVALGRAPHRGWFMPLTERDLQVVEKAIEQVGLKARRERISSELSGGEQQRMNLARVLAQEPSVLLLDEPTAHLDLKYQTEILNLIHKLAHRDGLTVIISLHDLNLAAIYADRVVLLNDGGIDAIGTPAEVMTSERLTSVYGVPILIAKHPSRDIPFILPDVQLMKEIDNE